MSQPALPSTQPQDPTLVGWLSNHTTLAWAATAVLTSVLGYGLALPEVATDMITSRGATDDQWTQIAFAAGYCLPLVISVFALALAYAQEAMPKDPSQFIVIGVVLAVSGAISHYIGLGLAPSLPARMVPGPPYVSIPLTAISAYLTTYGVPLAVCAVAIGLSAAAQLTKWTASAHS
jgi:hypothetical protein